MAARAHVLVGVIERLHAVVVVFEQVAPGRSLRRCQAARVGEILDQGALVLRRDLRAVLLLHASDRHLPAFGALALPLHPGDGAAQRAVTGQTVRRQQRRAIGGCGRRRHTDRSRQCEQSCPDDRRDAFFLVQGPRSSLRCSPGPGRHPWPPAPLSNIRQYGMTDTIRSGGKQTWRWM